MVVEEEEEESGYKPHFGSVARSASQRKLEREDDALDGDWGGHSVAAAGHRPSSESGGGILRPSTASRSRPGVRPSTATTRIQEPPGHPQLRARPVSALPASQRSPSAAGGGAILQDELVGNARVRPASAMSRQPSVRMTRPTSSMSRQSQHSVRDDEYHAPRSKMLLFDQVMAKCIDHGMTHKIFAKANEAERRSRPSSAVGSASTKKRFPGYQESMWTREKSEGLFRSVYQQSINTVYIKETKLGWKQFATISCNTKQRGGGGRELRRLVRDPLASENYDDWLKEMQGGLEREMDERGDFEQHQMDEDKRARSGKQRRLEDMYLERRKAAEASEEELRKNLRKTQKYLLSQQPGWDPMYQFEED